MFSFLRTLALGLAIIGGANGALAAPSAVSTKAQWIEARLDQMDVQDKWIAGAHVDWRTGEPDGRPESEVGRHTHCSAFAAAAAESFGIYLLRPPEHPQVLLANAQNEWLPTEGAGQGWQPLFGYAAAQDAANRGLFVVASYHNRNDDKPGHIAIVLPGTKGAASLASEGPDVMQAGTVNSARTSLRAGFSGHPGAFEGRLIAFYAHPVASP